MSRMRLLQGQGTGESALVCLYCGAEAESKPPYEVMYCYCRSTGTDSGGAPDAPGGPARFAARAG
jgi:hypothetical protein